MQLNVRDELKFSCKDMVTLHLFCPRGPSCGMGDSRASRGPIFSTVVRV
jgi:hypothetical protein